MKKEAEAEPAAEPAAEPGPDPSNIVCVNAAKDAIVPCDSMEAAYRVNVDDPGEFAPLVKGHSKR
jgi:hypothetical protein